MLSHLCGHRLLGMLLLDKHIIVCLLKNLVQNLQEQQVVSLTSAAAGDQLLSPGLELTHALALKDVPQRTDALLGLQRVLQV